MSLRTRLAPIRPSPTMPSCLVSVAAIVSSLVLALCGALARIRIPRQPRLMPVADPADEIACFLRPPCPLRVLPHRRWLAQQRLDHPPGLLHAVLAGEQVVVSGHGVPQQPLVGFQERAELLGEQHVEMHGLPRPLPAPP